jgi:hypothetical protein
MKPFRLIFLGCLILLWQGIKAQKLGIDSSSLDSLPSSVFLGDSFQLSIGVHNFDTASFTGILGLNFQTDSGGTIYTSGPNSTYGISSPLASVTIPGGSTFQLSIQFNFHDPPYKVGPSVVVIWPRAITNLGRTIANADTISRPINIDTLLASIPPTDPGNLKVYMANQQLWIKNEGQNPPQRVRIYDVLGSLILEKELTDLNPIPMGQYASGLYLAEVIFAGNERRIFKILYSEAH